MSQPSVVRVHHVQVHGDDRGTVFEPVGPEELETQRNAHVVLTEPGCVRGNHVHRKSTEILAVRGPARVRYRQDGEDHDLEIEAGAVVAVTIPPNVPHAVLNTGTELNVLVAFRDRPHDPADPDVERVTLLEPTR